MVVIIYRIINLNNSVTNGFPIGKRKVVLTRVRGNSSTRAAGERL